MNFGKGFQKAVKPINDKFYSKIISGSSKIRPEAKMDAALQRYNAGVIQRQANGVKKIAGFTGGFEKEAAGAFGMKPGTARKVYKGLEYGGLGTLAAIDLHEAHKAHKEGDKKGVRKGLLGAGALGGLMAATHIGSKVH